MEERTKIRDKLRDYHLTHVWLIQQLQRCGISTDKAEISSVFAGTRKGAKVDTMLAAASEILNQYEESFLHDESDAEDHQNN